MTNIFDNNLCVTGIGIISIFYNCKVTGESIALFQQENKFKAHKIFITLENNSVFL